MITSASSVLVLGSAVPDPMVWKTDSDILLILIFFSDYVKIKFSD